MDRGTQSGSKYAHRITTTIGTGTLIISERRDPLATPYIVRLILKDKSVLMLQFNRKTGVLENISPFA